MRSVTLEEYIEETKVIADSREFYCGVSTPTRLAGTGNYDNKDE